MRSASNRGRRVIVESNLNRRVMVRSRWGGRGRGGNKRDKRVMFWSKRDRNERWEQYGQESEGCEQ